MLALLPAAGAENWQVAWKDDTQTLKVDRDSVRVDGPQVEYWYSDTVDALVDLSEFRYRAVSDCVTNQMRLVEVHDPETGQTKPVQDSVWKDRSYNPDDPLAVMHHEICRDYGVR